MEINVPTHQEIKEIFLECLTDYFKNHPLVIEAGQVDNIPPVTQKELCKFLNVTPQTIIRWKRKNKIPFIQIGSVPRYNLKDVMKALGK